MNKDAGQVPVGSDGLAILPFGNGAERMLGNKNPGSLFSNIDFNRHSRAHVARAAQEGIVFSFKYGMEIMEQTGIQPSMIRAGKANMFLSPFSAKPWPAFQAHRLNCTIPTDHRVQPWRRSRCGIL